MNLTRTSPDTNADTPVWGVIASIQGTNPGPASGISYTIDVHKPGGGTVRVTGAVPMNDRFESIDIRAAKPGTFVLGVLSNANYYFQIIELPAEGGCTEAAKGATP